MAVADEIPLRPLPWPDAISAGFWEGAKAGELRIQKCRSCERWQHPPAIACMACGGEELGFQPLPGGLRLYSWTVLHDAPAPGFKTMLPLILGLAEAEAQQGLLIAANILDTGESALRLGMPLTPVSEPIGEDHVLVQFKPAAGQ